MRPWAIVVVILLVIFLIAAIAAIGFLYTIGKPPEVSRNSVIEVSFSGTLAEARSDNPFETLFASDKLTLYDYWKLFDYAARDDRVAGVDLMIEPLGFSWAQVEELRNSIHRYRESGRPIHAFLAVDLVTEKELYLAAAADSITLNPDTALLINGLAAEVTFFKRTLEKLGIRPEFMQFKEFKSPEIYDRTELSGPVREMYQSIIQDIQDRFTAQVAADREIEESVVREFLKTGMVTPDAAVQAKLIDAEGYRQEVKNRLKEDLGVEEYDSIRASSYMKSADELFAVSSRNRVAFVTGIGPIFSGAGDAFTEGIAGSTLAAKLREIKENDRFKAVLLRVDSPGGSAVGSDMIWKEIVDLEEAGKPVVVSMSGVAGSGGYYISMAAGKILCQPSTITGSIGVIFGKFDFQGFFDWLGMNVDRVKSAPNADIFSLSSSLTPEQKGQIEEWMRHIYDNFVSKAAEGRGSTFEELEAKAHGRIYTGAQAVAIGLADQLGGFDEAVASIKEALNLDEDDTVELVRYPRPKTVWEALTQDGFVQLRSQSDPIAVMKRWSRLLSVPAPQLLMPEAEIR